MKLNISKEQTRTLRGLAVWSVAAVAALVASIAMPEAGVLPIGLTVFQIIGLVCIILAMTDLCILASQFMLARSNKPLVEASMLGRIYQLVAGLIILLTLSYSFGQLTAVGSFLSLFGGMLLGWSLQAPVSGFAAWVMVSIKRPFRPGDRVQFPNLGLVGDVKELGIMYTRLDQVGGAIGSEEAVGRYILVPNAMLFSQVVINYTVMQEAPFMLDEVIVRITFDSDWDKAEQIMTDAATEATGDIILATGMKPYIRSDLYDYGVYLRLRYQTRVQKRAETAYVINKKIFEEFQCTPSVDLAIPYVYSNRAGADKAAKERVEHNTQEIEMDRIECVPSSADQHDIELLAQSIATQGLLQPIVVTRDPQSHNYSVVAGQLRYEACKHLGWRRIQAVVIEKKLSSQA